MKLLNKDSYMEDESLSKLGKEPFNMSGNDLFVKINKSNKPIKELILDQTNIAGLGNIYADEVLFLSNINPLVKGKDLNVNKCKEIVENSVIVLNKAIEAGGSTIRSYHSGNNVDGKFQNELNVYGKKGEKCPKCRSIIEKTVVGGRGTHYCPSCQKK
jgi:formamidopyrimidine-DNA glycosylase